MIKVVSWQCSGVAWQPWRTQQVLARSARVEYRAFASYPGLEGYGLPELPVVPDVLAAARGADVLQLHHAYVANDLIALIRAELPRVKIVVTLHGEPDRSLLRRACALPPDAYHVVDPDLLELCTAKLTRFLPNHPVIEEREEEKKERRLFVPFSHVPRWKNGAEAATVTRALRSLGWAIDAPAGRLTHAEMLQRIAAARVTWVQLQGYLDLLTMERRALGSLPIVRRPAPAALLEWDAALGFAAALSFVGGSAGELLAELSSWDGASTIRHNREGMGRTWTIDRCCSQWESFFADVA